MSPSSVTANSIQPDFMQTLHLDLDTKLDLQLQLPSNDKEPAPKIRLPSFGPNDFEALSMEFVAKKPASSGNTTSPSSPIPSSSPLKEVAATSPPVSDPYLSSIVAAAKPAAVVSVQERSPQCMCVKCKGKPSGQPVHCKEPVDCPCYRCQKQRRRAQVMGKSQTLATIKTSKPEPDVPVPTRTKTTIAPKSPPAVKPAMVKSNTMPARTMNLRKNPSVLSYNKHHRKDISPSDSIYDGNKQSRRTSNLLSDDQSMTSHTTIDSYCSNDDKYEISWKDETAGEDILEPLKCFIDIFETKPDDTPDGLSDLLEDGARRLKMEKEAAAQEAELARKRQLEQQLPPRLEVLTPSYRHGAPHRSLTLYHLMKCKQRSERLAAYSIAYNNCINGNSGLNDWMKKQNDKGLPTCMTVYTPHQQQQRKPSKKSLFRSPLRNNSVAIRSRPSRDQHSFMEHSNGSMFLSPFNESTTRISQDSMGARPTDVLKAASALLPGMNKHPDLNRSQTSLGIAKAYNHIDFPRRPSAKSHTDSESPSVSPNLHMNSQDEQPEEEKINIRPQQEIKWPARSASIPNDALDDLSSVLPHVDRATLQTYLDRADGDYMQALDLCKQAVKNGEL
ncbi:hypothetical protein K450DRAFT_251796 [Umbelopsis ramanniana AG]|uniref:Uncharacterized protein n=1 Tax=Umbelopsis ramanniana AG TaxID=1314678 RepID=A0AAD5E673_UMBRA|nr:uncharacterized protein K450DRAFT_251796 [Umbelopsis ramanniana AG]KAI8577467.1 hypothetical protein K450DRAFT_251796 [Umbelopsis ramanniana AG]